MLDFGGEAVEVASTHTEDLVQEPTPRLRISEEEAEDWTNLPNSSVKLSFATFKHT